MAHKDWVEENLDSLYSYTYFLELDRCVWQFSERVDAIRFALKWT